MKGENETEGKLSQEQVTLMAAVRSGDSSDRDASGCDSCAQAQIPLQCASTKCSDHMVPRQSSSSP